MKPVKELFKLINNLPGMFYRCKNDENWTMQFISSGCVNLTEYKEFELIDNKNISYNDLILTEYQEYIYKEVDIALNEKRVFQLEYKIKTKNNKIKWVWEQGIGVFNNNKLIAIEGFITDISRQKKIQERLNQEIHDKDRKVLISLSLLNEYKKAVDVSAIVSKADKKGIITYANDEFCKISGYSQDELIGKSHNIIRHPKTSNKTFKNLWETILNKNVWKAVIQNRKKDGSSYYVKTTIMPMLDEKGEINEFISIRTDVSEVIEQERKIQAQTTDSLTNLANRQKLIEDISISKIPKLAILNIDRFKEINDYYGYQIGDKVLIETGVILSNLIDKNTLKVYKLSADEFAILGCINITTENFVNICNKIIDIFDNTILKIDNNEFNISITIGMAIEKANIFINSEIALENAKETNKNFIFFDDSINIKKRHENNITWTKKLKEAIKEDRIVIFAQPIVNNITGNFDKYECLVRFKEKDGSIISPFYFLEISKRAKLYNQLTKIIIEKSLKAFSKRDEEFSINLTIDDILDESIVKFLTIKLKEYDIAKRVVLEIVESEGIENFSEVINFINNMKELGCKIAIDDFGTGYSNFEYLIKLNVDFIKIDGSIIKGIDRDKNSQIVAQIIVDFAKKLNIKTIGEYVHNKEVYKKVKELGITYTQGFHLGEPREIN